MAKYTITVTQEDIDSGIRVSMTECALALAVRRVFPNAEIGSYIYLGPWENPDTKRIDLLPKVAQFRMDFDSYGGDPKLVKPFSFDVYTDYVP